MRILLTNDDGIRAPGLLALAETLRQIAEVWVVAPDREQSASSHSLTLNRPLRLEPISDRRYSVDGTPADCVNLALNWLLRDRHPDLVVSGINHGLNLGDDVAYSGTVSGATEGYLLGVSAMAFSQELEPGYDFGRSAAIAARMLQSLAESLREQRALLNVNFPAAAPVGFAVTRLGRRVYEDSVVEKTDPRGRNYYWIGGTARWEREEGSDSEALGAAMISLTPLRTDRTDHDLLLRAAWLRDELGHELLDD